jgi:hypothetical protein
MTLLTIIIWKVLFHSVYTIQTEATGAHRIGRLCSAGSQEDPTGGNVSVPPVCLF